MCGLCVEGKVKVREHVALPLLWSLSKNSNLVHSFQTYFFFCLPMVRIKNRWLLFELVENPVIEHGQVVFPRTALGLTEEDIGRAIAAAINADFGDYGLGMTKSVNGIFFFLSSQSNDQPF